MGVVSSGVVSKRELSTGTYQLVNIGGNRDESDSNLWKSFIKIHIT